MIGLGCSISAYVIAVRSLLVTLHLLQKVAPLGEDSQKILESLKSTLVGIAIATGLLYFCLFGAGIYIYVENHTSKQAICALRTDLESRTSGTRAFLKVHPNGIPGVPIATIKEGLHNQDRSIKALSVLSC